ncbi:HNH endonuclease [Aquamicrobium zhengzhouense]|uniref:Putative HNH nuclease YajD n=1 Tax=Aquamicrobium zhengzhouense TaxID=2781738 RepID=A0ABS0SFB1_9HYPH|nr:HNH endonuclease signature motif containing protein [Aquamicrobium zhengzhouense]MBI1621489.1 HNH endonuclease [Aquamicrobium zhengzhouense]
MAKLKTLKPLVGKLPPRLGYQPGNERERSRHRDSTQGWRAWYKTARWQKLRWSVLVRDLFTCQMCSRAEADTSLLVGDHIKPHRGDETLFWDASNIQCLCKRCHDRHKQRDERRY